MATYDPSADDNCYLQTGVRARPKFGGTGVVDGAGRAPELSVMTPTGRAHRIAALGRELRSVTQATEIVDAHIERISLRA